MLGFNKKIAHVIWRHEYYNRIVVLEIKESRTVYAVANTGSKVTSLRGEFTDDCIQAIDESTHALSDPNRPARILCEVLARSYSKDAMQLVAENIDSCIDTSRRSYREKL